MHQLWFVFARRSLQFSLVEFHAITGLECNATLSLKEFDKWEDDGGFWSKVLKRKEGIYILTLWKKHKEAVKKWSNIDRIRLVYLCIIVCVVLARDEKANIPLKYIKVVMDLEKLRKYPWGVSFFDLLCDSVAKTRDKLKEKTTSYVLDGFSYALQILAIEAVLKIGKLCGKKLDKGFKNGPRCINWMEAAKVSYEEIIRLENIFASEDVIYPYISWEENMVVLENANFRRNDDVKDDRVTVLMELIRTEHDFNDHIWEFQDTTDVSFELDEKCEDDEVAENDEEVESDEDFRTPRGSVNSSSTAKKGKKRPPDRGMEKRKHKVLSSKPQHSPFNEDMKAFVAQLFQQNFSAMEERLQKQMDAKFEQMQSEFKDSLKDVCIEVEHTQPSPSNLSPSKPSTSKQSTSKQSTSKQSTSNLSPTKPSTSKPSPRRSKRGVKKH
ncbi:hypothetical protein N665_0953s0006 [Sinapis alba]|nr:hypothetical protein N665_0953s0006 [Sinapis alba]